MSDIKNILKKLKLSFAFEEDEDGEPYSFGFGFTSKTYHGEFKNKRAIFKLSTLKNSKLKTITNNYLHKNIIKQLTSHYLCPNILFVDKKNNLLISEYIEDKKNLSDIIFPIFGESYFIDADLSNQSIEDKYLRQLGEGIKKIHSVKPPKKFITFKDQLNIYQELLLGFKWPEENHLEQAINLLKDITKDEDKGDFVFSHNDLNILNILHTQNKTYFIDWEFASINSKYFDLVSVIHYYKLHELDINNLFIYYGLDINDISIYKKIKEWKKIHENLILIWAAITYKYLLNDEVGNS